jgi:hypothetical protein
MRRTCLLALGALACSEYDIVPPAAEVDAPLDTGAPPPVDTSPPPEDTAVEEPPEDTDPPTATETEPEEPIAQDPVYANTSGSLYSVDPETGDALYIGDMHAADGTPVVNFIDLAIDLGGRLYGGTFDALYRIDPVTAAVTEVCSFGVDMTALTFTSAGQLVAGGASTIELVDVDTCAVEVLVSGSIYETSGDLVGLPDGYLYWTVWGTTGDDLVRVDPTSGAQTYVGPIGVDRLFGLGYDGGQLYGFSSEGEIVRVPPGGGVSEITAISSTLSWWGATTNPVTW